MNLSFTNQSIKIAGRTIGLALACLFSNAYVQADTVVLGVDFNAGFSGITQSGAAADGNAGDVWNATPTFGGFTGIESNGNFGTTPPYGSFELNDKSGALSGISHSVSYINDDNGGFDGVFSNPSVTATGGQNLMGDYIFVGGADAGDSLQFELSGLATDTAYAIYLYGNGDTIGQGATWTLNGASQTSALDSSATWDLGGEYARFEFNTGANTTQSFAASEFNGGFAVNGYQLALVTAVPEPTSLLLIGLASMTGFATRRRGQISC